MSESSDKEKNSAISMHDFLDFLKITCQVNDSITNKAKNHQTIDYNQLAKNELVNNILNRPDKVCSPVKKDSFDDHKKGDKKIFKRRSNSHSKSSKTKHESIDSKLNIDTILSDKLEEVLNEGILDSILPFICPPNQPSTSNTASQYSMPSTSKAISKPQVIFHDLP